MIKLTRFKNIDSGELHSPVYYNTGNAMSGTKVFNIIKGYTTENSATSVFLDYMKRIVSDVNVGAQRFAWLTVSEEHTFRLVNEPVPESERVKLPFVLVSDMTLIGKTIDGDVLASIPADRWTEPKY